MSRISLARRAMVGSALALAAGLSMAPLTAQAAGAYPDKPLRFIVPYPPGGPLDTTSRLLAKKVQAELGQPVVVENRAGAGGDIGADLIAKASPDGYTLGMGAVAINAINPWLYSKLPFNPDKDFAPVTIVASVPNVLEVNLAFAQKNHIKTVHDLIAYAKAHPGKLNFGSGGNGSAGHLAGALFNLRAGIKTEHIPYQGAAPAQLALLSGQSDFMFDNLASSAGLIKDGKVLALAVTTAKRSSLLPELPTMEQAGVKDFDLGTWFGIITTGGTPPAIVEKLNKAYADALHQPDVRKLLLSMGSDIQPMSVAQFTEFVKREKAKYKQIVKASGAHVN